MGKVAVVSGASYGIGEHIAKQLANKERFHLGLKLDSFSSYANRPGDFSQIKLFSLRFYKLSHAT